MRLSVLALIALSACAPTIPKPALMPSANAPPPRATVEACLLLGETADKPLAVGVDALTLDTWHLGLAAILIRHPSGPVVIDPSFGSQIAQDTETAPIWFRLAVMGEAKTKTPTADLLEKAGVDPLDVRQVLLSHGHWDHAGGLRDLPRAKVLLSAAEYENVRSIAAAVDHGALRSTFHIRPSRMAPFEFDGPPYEGFSASHDVFGDGSVIAVPMPGHTPGSAGYFLQAQKRYLYIGDAAWTLEGVRRPAHKSALARALADRDVGQASETLGILHALFVERPDLVIVPAHDLGALQLIPPCSPAVPPARP